MVLLDTSIWVDHFRSKHQKWKKLIEEPEIFMHNAILGELMLGYLNPKSEAFQLLQKLPLIPEASHKEVVDVIYEVVPQESIAWISLGTFRFPPNLKTIATKRFPKSKIFYGEFIPANGKMRYFRPLREEIYGKMREWIGNRSKYITPYLCMETPQVCKHYNSISE